MRALMRRVLPFVLVLLLAVPAAAWAQDEQDDAGAGAVGDSGDPDDSGADGSGLDYAGPAARMSQGRISPAPVTGSFGITTANRCAATVNPSRTTSPPVPSRDG